MTEEEATTGYVIADYGRIEGVSCPCGTTHRAFTDLPEGRASLHMVEVSRRTRTHYHKRLTEIYYFLEGRGRMELDGESHEVRPGMAVYIPPGVRHRAVPGEEPMRILNFVTPPFDPEDEWFD
ncbi:MAG: cupin domain-containing protein [Planctomycetota bacterium]